MDARQERGLQLAQRGHITKHAGGWKVLSQSGNGSYFVHLEDNPSCTCPDFELRQQPALHQKSGQKSDARVNENFLVSF